MRICLRDIHKYPESVDGRDVKEFAILSYCGTGGNQLSDIGVSSSDDSVEGA